MHVFVKNDRIVKDNAKKFDIVDNCIVRMVEPTTLILLVKRSDLLRWEVPKSIASDLSSFCRESTLFDNQTSHQGAWGQLK